VHEISHIFNVSSLGSKDFEKLEDEIFTYVGDDGKYGNSVSEYFGISNTALKALAKRSNKLAYTGLRLTRIEEPPSQ
jgi:predicted DNA-binding ArsR family transcriptional regulator